MNIHNILIIIIEGYTVIYHDSDNPTVLEIIRVNQNKKRMKRIFQLVKRLRDFRC